MKSYQSILEFLIRRFLTLFLISIFSLGCVLSKNTNNAHVVVVDDINPKILNSNGGSVVTFSGQALDTVTKINIGNKECAIGSKSSTEIVCTSTSDIPGSYSVALISSNKSTTTLANTFTLKSNPTVTSISPNLGSIDGGTVVTITGTELSAIVKVEIKGVACTSLVVNSPTQLTCTTPSNSAGLGNVKVYMNDQLYGTGSNLFTYKTPPIVNSVSPIAGALAGGSTITLTGSGFDSNSVVKMGSGFCGSINLLSSTTLTCTTPANASGAVSINVLDLDNLTRIKSNAYTYEAAPTVTNVSPAESGLGGGRSVTIFGTGFLPGVTATIGGSACLNPQYLTPITLICNNPVSLTSGLKDIVVTNFDNQSGTKTNVFTYNLAPTIASVSPSVGSLSGLTPITITGTNFHSGAIVSLDSSQCGSVVVVNSTTITCLSPGHAFGAVNMNVLNTDMQSGYLANAFTYQLPPATTNITPAIVSSGGGTTITLTGTSYKAGATVSIAGSPCSSPNVISDTQMTCIVPAHAAGLVSLTVLNTDTQSGTFANSLTYSPISVININPAIGILAGGTGITITGTGFSAGAVVDVGGAPCTGVVVASATSITCNIPAHTSGVVNVTVTNVDTSTANLINSFTYQSSPSISSLTPISGALVGGTTLTLNGSNFASGAIVSIGGVNCGTVSVISSTKLTCITGARAAGLVSAVVTNVDTQSGSLSNSYTYQAGPSLSTISPTEGISAGGTALTLNGTNFVSGATVSIGGTPCANVTFIDASKVLCTSPAHLGGANNVVVTNPDGQVSSLTNGYFFNFILNGTLTYDSVPTALNGLNFQGTVQKPMRNIFVELVNDTGGAVINSMSTDDLGKYSFIIPSTVTSVHLKVWAEMSSPSIKVVDNTNSQASYILISNSASMVSDVVKNMNASSGWTGTNTSGSYSGARNAAPFSIIDAVYSATKKINTARPAIVFPALKINWSINNINVYGNRLIGQVGWKFYDPTVDEIFLLGTDGVDTDEFDTHILVHEWGHFFEAHLSKSNNSGGVHYLGDEKDMTMAFGEGWGNALSAMVLDPDPLYVDSQGARSQGGFNVDIANYTDVNKGWFSEVSIMQLLYYLYDSNVRAGDNIALGIGPIIDVLVGYEKTTPAATSIFSFIYGLKQSLPAQSANIDTLLATKNISAITSPYGVGETHNGGWSFNLPIYNPLVLGGSTVAVKLLGANSAASYHPTENNSVYNSRYFYTTASSTTTQINVTTSDSFGIIVYKNGAFLGASNLTRSTSSAIGPYHFNISTAPGDNIIIRINSDGATVFDKLNYVDVLVGVIAL